jgi:hypothetical protein
MYAIVQSPTPSPSNIVLMSHGLWSNPGHNDANRGPNPIIPMPTARPKPQVMRR